MASRECRDLLFSSVSANLLPQSASLLAIAALAGLALIIRTASSLSSLDCGVERRSPNNQSLHPSPSFSRPRVAPMIFEPAWRICWSIRQSIGSESMSIVGSTRRIAHATAAELHDLDLDGSGVVGGDPSGGKAATLNAAVRASRSEILVLRRYRPVVSRRHSVCGSHRSAILRSERSPECRRDIGRGKNVRPGGSVSAVRAPPSECRGSTAFRDWRYRGDLRVACVDLRGRCHPPDPP